MSDTTYDRFKREHPELLAAAEAELEVTEEIARLTAEVERLRLVHESELGVCEKYCNVVGTLQARVDAARTRARTIFCSFSGGERWAASEILRALDGELCPTCSNKGTVTVYPEGPLSGFTPIDAPCPMCGGQGWTPEHGDEGPIQVNCPDCHGTGRKP